jgi:transposase-like protein
MASTHEQFDIVCPYCSQRMHPSDLSSFRKDCEEATCINCDRAFTVCRTTATLYSTYKLTAGFKP